MVGEVQDSRYRKTSAVWGSLYNLEMSLSPAYGVGPRTVAGSGIVAAVAIAAGSGIIDAVAVAACIVAAATTAAFPPLSLSPACLNDWDRALSTILSNEPFSSLRSRHLCDVHQPLRHPC